VTVSFVEDDDTTKESDESFASAGRGRKTSSSASAKPLHERKAGPLSLLAEALDVDSPMAALKTPAAGGKKKLFSVDLAPVVRFILLSLNCLTKKIISIIKYCIL
jgi:hypothetical protein